MVIPTLAGGRRFRELLAALAAQRPPATGLVVVDSGSQDGTPEAAEEAGACVLRIPPGSFDHGLTRNHGAQALPEVDAIVFLVQDAVPVGPRWLATLGAAALQEGVAAATARQRPPRTASALTRATVDRSPMAAAAPRRIGPFAPGELERVSPRRWRSLLLLDDVACALRAAVFRPLGFRATSFGEDALLAYDLLRGGWALAHEPAAVVEHGHEYAPQGAAQRYETDARFFRERFGLRLRPTGLHALKGFLAELAADGRWLGEHPAERGRGLLLAAARLRWAQARGQRRGSRGPVGALPEARPVPRPEELAA